MMLGIDDVFYDGSEMPNGFYESREAIFGIGNKVLWSYRYLPTLKEYGLFSFVIFEEEIPFYYTYYFRVPRFLLEKFFENSDASILKSYKVDTHSSFYRLSEYLLGVIKNDSEIERESIPRWFIENLIMDILKK